MHFDGGCTRGWRSLALTAVLVIGLGPVLHTNAAAEVGWPALDEAQIRPGVRVVTDGGQCTANFVFRDLLSGDLLLGLAAHCVDDVDQSSTIHGINGAPASRGTVAYRSFDYTDGHDFALVRVADEDVGKVHPAVLHFGGPTAMADTSDLVWGERFLFYGNSGLRLGVEESNWHEGYVTGPGAEKSYGLPVKPGVPGDSGSGVLDAEGRAIGVLITVGVSASICDQGLCTGTNGFTNLDVAVALAEASTGMDLELQTWDVLEPGLLPALSTM